MPYYGDQKREYDRLRASTARAEFVASRGGICAKCGSSEQIEIDHIDPKTKEYKIATIWSRKKEIREYELAKCQLLCNSCHKEKSAREATKDLQHGTLNMYKARHCRCQPCKDANAERAALNKKLKRERDQQNAPTRDN